MAGITFVKVIDAGPRYTTVLADDGKTYTLKGDRNWRNNNPGNIEYGDFAKSKGAIGSDGRFAVFPSIDQGFSAQESLQFEGKSYRDKSIADAISRYAPAFENDTAAYAAEVAAAAGVPVTTKMSDLTPEQRKAFLAAQHRVEGMKPGTIMGAEGEPVDPEIAKQFSAVRLPPGNIGGNGNAVRDYQQQLAQRGFDPGPVDGVKGPRTTAAIKAFQKANGLDDDGIVGPLTRAKLAEAGGSYTLDPPPIPSNEEMPPRPTNSWRTYPDAVTGAETRAEQRTLGNRSAFSPLPAPKSLVAPEAGKTLGGRATGAVLGTSPGEGDPSRSWWFERNFMSRPVNGTNAEREADRRALEANPAAQPPAAPAPAGLPDFRRPVVAAAPPVEEPAPTGGGFNLGTMLGGLGNAVQGGLNTLGTKAQEAGKTLGSAATNVVEGTKTALGNTADATKDLLANELMGTVGGRTLLLNTALGITPAKTADDRKFERNAAAPEGYGYGASGKKLYKIGQTYNSSRGQVVFDGSKFVLSPTQVRSSVDIPSSGRAPAISITPRTTGRTDASRGETFDKVWNEAKGY